VAKVEDKQTKQTSYKIANERLESALLRLEKILAKQTSIRNSEDIDQITALVMENKKLKDTNKIFEERLSGAIKKLKNILKEA